MTKVYPNAGAKIRRSVSENIGIRDALPDPSPTTITENSVVLTVWKKSLLLSCDGFTVFDAKGNLVFRVDSYIAGSKGEIVLMDASGKSLLTIRRKRLSLADNWMVFEGDSTVNPLYSVRKSVNLLNKKCIAHVISSCDGEKKKKKKVMYEVEGSYSRRCCAVYDDKRRRMAEIRRKEAAGGVSFGLDVFRLVILQPELDSAVAMAFVILLDQMFGSRSRFST